MTVLVTGGAGYIGSHFVRALVERGERVAVVDSLRSGHRDAVSDVVPFLEADIADRPAVAAFMRQHGISKVVHFAALIQVGESVRDPRAYYRGNLGATMALVETALDHDVKAFVFSSTAAVYGIPTATPIPEEHACVPINPYGETKLAIERMLESYGRAYGLGWAALRYFNAAGAHESGDLGERHEPESHLIPLVLDAALGKSQTITVYGSDYPTADGTCVRDYVHVSDLAEAHLAALRHLEGGGECGAFNLGTGSGHSVNQVIAACSRVTGRPIDVAYGPRRPGDPPVLVAAAGRANQVLKWRPSRSSLETIVQSAWQHRRRAAP